MKRRKYKKAKTVHNGTIYASGLLGEMCPKFFWKILTKLFLTDSIKIIGGIYG
jgi:hypothetical protein